MRVGKVVSIRKLNRREQLKDIQTRNGNFIANKVVVSNCHHVPADTFAAVVQRIRARYKFGVTATPYRTDGLQRIFRDHLGGISVIMRVKTLDPSVVIWDFCPSIDFTGAYMNKDWNYSRIVTLLSEDDEYNRFLLWRIQRRAISEDRPTLVIADRTKWCERLEYMVKNELGYGNVAAAHGKMAKGKRKKALDAHIIIGTKSLFAEYIDIPRLEALINGTPFGTGMRYARSEPENPLLEQMIGRLQRFLPDKRQPIFEDIHIATNRMIDRLAKQRRRFYVMKKYQITDERYDP